MITRLQQVAFAAMLLILAPGIALAQQAPSGSEAAKTAILATITEWGAAAIVILTAFMVARWALKAMKIAR